MSNPYFVWNHLYDDIKREVLKHACLEMTLERTYRTSEPDLFSGDLEVCEKWCFKRPRPTLEAFYDSDFGKLTVTLTRYLSPSMLSKLRKFGIDTEKIKKIQNRVSYEQTWSSVTSIEMKAERREKRWLHAVIETFYVYRLHLYQDTTEGKKEMEETPESHLPRCCFFEDDIQRFEDDLKMEVIKNEHHGEDNPVPPDYTVFMWLPADDDDDDA